MNIHSNKGNSKEVEDVSTRVKKTKLEIEQLKNELQQLLTSGTHPETRQTPLFKHLVEITKPQTPATSNAAVVQRRDPPIPKHVPATLTKEELRKKVKNYNVAGAREYIKKQREMRAEEIKAKIDIAHNQVDLKKEKLRELHQKALELVNKNVQLKRERSKSRDKEPPVRLDKSNPRHKSQENIGAGRPNLAAKSQERLKPPLPAAARGKSQDKAKVADKSKSQDRLKLQEQVKPTNERISRARTRGAEAVVIPSRSLQKTDPNYLYPPNVKLDANTQDVAEFEKTFFPPFEKAESDVDLNKGMLISGKSQTRISPKAQTKSQRMLNVADTKLQGSKFKKQDERISSTRGKRVETVCALSTSTQKLSPQVKFDSNNIDVTDFEKGSFSHFESIEAHVDLNKRIPERDRDERAFAKNITQRSKKPKVLELSVMTDACLKDTKETQTNCNFGEAAWMQPPPTLPYPYNFISTVKRKLQQAINSPRGYVDVGVQNSCDNLEETPEVERTKSKEEIKEMLIKSTSGDLRSFASHKGPNLDLQVVENLELVANGNGRVKSSKDGISRNLFTGYDSESDTSKNIPEISSESLTSATSKPHLSFDKLKDLRLQKLAKTSSHSNIQTDVNGVEKQSYSSDFQKESIGSVKSKSTSTIKTVVTENKRSDLGAASETSLTSNSYSGSATNYAPSTTHISNEDEATSKRSVQNFTNFINKSLRGDGDVQRSFKSLLSDSQASKSLPIANPQFFTESLGLKQPSVSLTVNKGQYSDMGKVLMNTVTIRSATDNTSFENVGSGDDSQGTFKSLLIMDKSSRSSTESVPEMLVQDTSTKTEKVSTSLSLREPNISLKIAKAQKQGDIVKNQMKNITLKSAVLPNNTVNELHLKFEAEVRLLNDFNESFKQLKAVEEAFETLKNKHETNLAMTKTLQNVDTQTSIVTKTSTNVTTTERSPRGSKNSSINFSRGSEIVEELNDSIVTNNRNVSKSLQNSSFSTDWNLSNLNESSVTNVSTAEEGRSKLSISGIENFDLKLNNCASILSLNIFDQLIKDEDTRIQQLKTIIKIREQALLDRTKSELVWLDIQKKQLIETGKIEEASLLKKKQRGIILKHEQERNEIKKLKQMQKEASEHRKNTLKQQRNLIKSQLCTDNMLSQITVKKRKERRSVGPLRVVQSCSESIHSETSISLKSSGMEDILSITSKSLRLSEESEYDLSKVQKEEEVPVSTAKRTLLMREAALQKRRKAAEELLRWHRKLLDEERKISELEAAATSVVRQEEPKKKEKYKFDGKQLNQLWKNMTGCDDKKFVEDKVYIMSQMTLERLCKGARQYANRNKKTLKHSEQSNENSGVSDGEKSAKKSDDVNYSSAFEPESVQEIISQEEKTKISSISELIDNFSRIEDEISTLSKKSEDIVSLNEDSEKSSQALTPHHIPEEIRIEKDVSEKTVPEESEASSFKDFEEEKEETSVIEAVEESSIKLSPKDVSPKEELISTQERTRSAEAISSSIEDHKQVSTKTEDLEEPKSIPEKTDESISTEKVLIEVKLVEQIQEEDEHSTTPEDQETTVDEQISKDIEEFKLVQEIPTLIEDQEITTDDQISVNEDIADLEPLQRISEDHEIPSKDVSAISQELEEIKNVETSEELSEHKLEQTPSEQISTEEEKSITPTSVEDESSEETSDEHTPPMEEQPSEDKAELIDVGKELLSLEEALESASRIEESLSKLNEKLISNKKDEIAEDITTDKEDSTSKTTSKSYISSSVHTEEEEKTADKKSVSQIDVKKRVSEILADASLTRGDKSPRLQDLYITAYDVGATNSPEFNDIEGRPLPPDIYGSEAEELRRKQLAIEQEIKQIELQQKEQLPYMFMREIPNKPPPPYTPPSSLSSLPQTILPSEVKEITEIASYSSKVLFKAYQNNNLDKVKFSENGFKLFSKVEVTKNCAEYVFDICRDVAKNHYRQFERCEEPTWLALAKKPQLAKTKPSDATSLEKILIQKLKELFGFKKAQVAESAIIKWGRKKRDHVDEVLVIESQEEESQWTNFDKDELIVKSQVTDDIMKMLLEETATVFAKMLSKKKSVVSRACDKSE